MTTTNFIIAAGIFVMGAAVAFVVFVSIGIRHEERLFREDRRFREEQGNWPGPDGPNHFLSEVAPGLVSHGARAMTGLWIRRDRGAAPLTVPWYERQP